MTIIFRQMSALRLLVLMSSLGCIQGAHADTTTIIEKRTDEVVPSSRQIIMQTQAVRPHYYNRLERILDQINLGIEKRWLTDAQAATLKDQQTQLINMLTTMLQSDGGMLSRMDADQMEHSVNGLAIAVTTEINKRPVNAL